MHNPDFILDEDLNKGKQNLIQLFKLANVFYKK